VLWQQNELTWPLLVNRSSSIPSTPQLHPVPRHVPVIQPVASKTRSRISALPSQAAFEVLPKPCDIEIRKLFLVSFNQLCGFDEHSGEVRACLL
jgi:hypothetical protein